MSDYLALK